MASLLDTDVVSQWSKPVPEERVARWLGTVALEETFISVVTVQELRAGIERLPAGRKRSGLDAWLSDSVLMKYKARILPVTLEIADFVRTNARQQRLSRFSSRKYRCLYRGGGKGAWVEGGDAESEAF